MKKTIILTSIIVLGVFLFISGCGQQDVTCNSPYIKVGTSCCLDRNSNSVCDTDETQNSALQPSTPQQPSEAAPSTHNVEISSLSNFVELSIKRNFPNEKGTFVKFSDMKDKEGCFEYLPYIPCTTWIYPTANGVSHGEISSSIFDFGEKPAQTQYESGRNPISLNEVRVLQMSNPGVEKRTLTNGDIIIQSYGPPDYGPSYNFEAKVPCGNRYWVYVGVSEDKPIGEGPFLNIANEILNFCK